MIGHRPGFYLWKEPWMEVGTSRQTSLLPSKESSDPIKPTLLFVPANINSSQRIFFAHGLGFYSVWRKIPFSWIQGMKTVATHCLLLMLVWTWPPNSCTENIFFFLHRNIYKPFNMQFLKGRSKRHQRYHSALKKVNLQYSWSYGVVKIQQRRPYIRFQSQEYPYLCPLISTNLSLLCFLWCEFLAFVTIYFVGADVHDKGD